MLWISPSQPYLARLRIMFSPIRVLVKPALKLLLTLTMPRRAAIGRLINWARVAGNELVDVKEDNGVIMVRIRIKGK